MSFGMYLVAFFCSPLYFLITLGLAGGPRPGAESYRQGHEDGKEDRKR